MSTNESILIDLLEEQFQDLEYQIEENLEAFLVEELWSLQRSFIASGGDYKELKEELLDLMDIRVKPSADASYFVDFWTNKIFSFKDLGTSNRCRQLLIYLYSTCDEGGVFEWIGQRFKLNKTMLLQKANQSIVFDWLLLWMIHSYPNISLMILGGERLKPFEYLKDISLEKVIKYLPEFMLWGLSPNLNMSWKQYTVKHLAEGKNLRTIEKFPIPCTKKMAHYFINAPREYTFDEAVWYGVILGMGGNLYLKEVFQEHFGRWEDNFIFIKTIVEFFVKQNQDLEKAELRQLLNYLRHIWDENKKLDMKGWTLDSLRRRTRAWQDEIQRQYIRNLEIQRRNAQLAVEARIPERWTGASYKPFNYRDKGQVFEIVQLNSTMDLFYEGREMQHCVGGYTIACVERGVSIWSLREKKGSYAVRLATIEVTKEGRIIQVRRKYNAAPMEYQRTLVKKWAAKEGLTF